MRPSRAILAACILALASIGWAQEEITGQLSIGGGTAAGLHVDADVASSGIGIFVEKGIGTAGKELAGPGPAYVTIAQSATADAPSLLLSSHNSAATQPGVISFRHSRGTYASPTATQANDVLGTILWQPFGGAAAWGTGDAGLETYSTETTTATARGTKMSFYNTTTGTATLNRWDLGWTSEATRLQTLPTGTTPTFYGWGRDAVGNTTETTAGLRTPVPAIHVFSMTCAVTPNAGTGSDALTFALRDDAADVTGITGCTITTSATSCAVKVATPTAVATGSLMAISVTGTSSPAATEGWCTVIYTVDAWSN